MYYHDKMLGGSQIYFQDPFPGISLQMGVHYKAASGGFTKYKETDQHSDKGTYISTRGNQPYCEYLQTISQWLPVLRVIYS